MRSAAEEAGIALQTAQAGSMFGFFFSAQPVTNYAEAKAYVDTRRYGRFFHVMLERGVYLAPSQFEAAFLSTAHTPEIVDATIEALPEAFAVLNSA
jgi:glutamate-1-semialdehyde 2,1-aminomutase